MTPNYEATKAYLEEHNAFDGKIPPIIDLFANAIPFATVPYRMKATIAISEIITFASQFRRNIVLNDGTSIPVNTIAFVLTGSGQNKDSSVRYARKALQSGYDMIDKERKHRAVAKAKQLAREAGEEMWDNWEIAKKYYDKPEPIFLAPTTVQGLVRHTNEIGVNGLGAGLIYSGEFGDQLTHGEHMMAMIETISELYDLGEKEAKYTQGKDTRSDAISGQALNALMVGSPVLLYDENTKKKFISTFMSKLARRSFLCYVPEILKNPQLGDALKIISHKREIKAKAAEARDNIGDVVNQVAEYGIANAGKDIQISQEVEDLFEIYYTYNEEMANMMSSPNSAAVLVRKHLQWKALKLAGAFAIFARAETVEPEHYIAAIKFCEMLSEDMDMFEQELHKFAYERFADYMKTYASSGGVGYMTVHEMKKSGFINTTTRHKLLEFINLAAAYDPTSVYTLIEDGTSIKYERIIETDTVTLSFKPIDNTRLIDLIANDAPYEAIKAEKGRIAKTAQSEYTRGETTFEDVGALLTKDFAYSPFIYRDDTRGKDNIISGTKMIVFDIDKSTITAEEAHFMLSDINHHIALSSDPNNNLKFRVIIELDSVVDLDPLTWSYFYKEVANELSLEIDA